MSNDQSFVSLKAGLDIAEIYLKDVLKPIILDSNQNTQDNQIKAFDSELTVFEGEYYSSELTTSYKITIKDNKLIMSHRRLSDIELTQIGINKFSGINTFGFEMEFMWNGQKVVGFEISNFGAKNVIFGRK